MMSPAMIHQLLLNCQWIENDITNKIIIPCLNSFSVRNALKLREIKFTGGTSELGNDIEYYENFGPDMLRFYTGVQVKKGNIGLGETTSLITQGSQAFEKEISDIASGHIYRINRWVVATTGAITEQAKQQIIQQLSRYAKPIHFWDGPKISSLILEYYYREFIQVMGIDPRIAASQNVITNYWDPDQPMILADDFNSTSFKQLNLQNEHPMVIGLLITVKPLDHSIPSATCIIRSDTDEITVDSLQSQLQPYLIKFENNNSVEAKLLDETRTVQIQSRASIFVR
ncbi:PDDEXK family nuclease [Desulfonatronum thiodismutans]|uniref:hypothetical protein n=1 Tax=Desulfonatronum thiodismutans TaxID=159290 RepID=UPI0004ABE5DC|nr:hypothetical protein [Desulfonatronum thiodismutans]